MTCIALIGFGEVGTTLVDDLATRSARLSAWDIQFADDKSAPVRALAGRSIRRANSSADAVREADIVISAVTAATTLRAANDAAASLPQGALFLDLNSASPEAKRMAAQTINDAGGRYVEAAVMAPIAPKRIAVEMLLGGPHAEAALPTLHKLGFIGANMFSDSYGKAAAAKLCRSVVVKGMEALLAESLLTARHYGVEDTVLASLSNLFPLPDWPELARYMVSRAIEHGERRSEEMREAARAVEDTGLCPLLSDAIAERQAWAAQYATALQHNNLNAMLDAIRSMSREA